MRKIAQSLSVKTKRDMILKLLPLHGFKIAPAAIECGYTPTYARATLVRSLKDDVDFCRKLEKLKEQHIGTAEDKLKAADAKLQAICDDLTLTVQVKLKALELYYRRNGALTDKHITETSERKQELTQSQRSEAKRLAILRFKTDKAG